MAWGISIRDVYTRIIILQIWFDPREIQLVMFEGRRKSIDFSTLTNSKKRQSIQWDRIKIVRSKLYFGLPIHRASMLPARMAVWNNTTSLLSYFPRVSHHFSWSSVILSPLPSPYRPNCLDLGLWLYFVENFVLSAMFLVLWHSHLAASMLVLTAPPGTLECGLGSNWSGFWWYNMSVAWVSERVRVCACV